MLVVVCGSDAALCGDGMRAARRVADAENLDIVAKFTERCSCRSATETGAYHDDLKLSFVVRANKTDF